MHLSWNLLSRRSRDNRAARYSSLCAILLCFVCSLSGAIAGTAKWRPQPASGDWNTAANWQPATVPNGPADIARFALSHTTGVSISSDTEVNRVQFLAGASAFTLTIPPLQTLTISGIGITNSSGISQNFVTASDGAGNDGVIDFTNSATAGILTSFTNNSGAASTPRGTEFFDTSSAGSANFVNNGGTFAGAPRGATTFFDNSTAGNAIFTNNPSTSGFGGATEFFDNATAGNGTFTQNPTAIVGADSGVAFFFDTSTAGNGHFLNHGGITSGANSGITQFADSSTAANSVLTNESSAASGVEAGITAFRDTSDAGNCAITNAGSSVSGAPGGLTFFEESPSAGSATFINNGGTVSGAAAAITSFGGTSTASSSTLIANGGSGGGDGGKIFFSSSSTGGVARVELFGNGNLDITGNANVTVGSIEGTGLVILGAGTLSVGSNNLSTTFSGVVQDAGGGSLIKIGTGTLTLAGINTYTGGTTVNGGVLLIKKANGSGTGTGAVQVNSGTLGGTGVIAGGLTVGTTPDMGAFLAPGLNGIGTLTTQGLLHFIGGANFQFELNSSTGKADRVMAKGVSITGFATFASFSFTDLGNGTLAPGTVFAVISNTASTPFGGRFTNLADGSTFTAGSNTYRARYTGGDGNDLTLTVQ